MKTVYLLAAYGRPCEASPLAIRHMYSLFSVLMKPLVRHPAWGWHQGGKHNHNQTKKDAFKNVKPCFPLFKTYPGCESSPVLYSTAHSHSLSDGQSSRIATKLHLSCKHKTSVTRTRPGGTHPYCTCTFHAPPRFCSTAREWRRRVVGASRMCGWMLILHEGRRRNAL